MLVRYCDDVVSKHELTMRLEGREVSCALVHHGVERMHAVSDQTILGSASLGASLRTLAQRGIACVYPALRSDGISFEHIRIGRAENADVSIALPEVSSFHAYLTQRPNGDCSPMLTRATARASACASGGSKWSLTPPCRSPTARGCTWASTSSRS